MNTHNALKLQKGCDHRGTHAVANLSSPRSPRPVVVCHSERARSWHWAFPAFLCTWQSQRHPRSKPLVQSDLDRGNEPGFLPYSYVSLIPQNATVVDECEEWIVLRNNRPLVSILIEVEAQTLTVSCFVHLQVVLLLLGQHSQMGVGAGKHLLHRQAVCLRFLKQSDNKILVDSYGSFVENQCSVCYSSRNAPS